jgi:catecholate siderophore receptor
MDRRLPAAATTLLALLAPPLTAWAAEAPIAASDAAAAIGAGDVVVTGVKAKDFQGQNSLTKLPADLHDIPQSITVLNKSLLQSQGATSLADALRNVPGITIGGAEGGQIGNNINLNGFTARTDIYLDGFRDRGQYYRDTFALQSVEVLMGPSSMLFGRGSTGGAINQVSKTPSLSPASEFSVSDTTNGLARGVADINQPLSDNAALRVSVMGQEGAPTTRRQMSYKDYGLGPGPAQ